MNTRNKKNHFAATLMRLEEDKRQENGPGKCYLRGNLELKAAEHRRSPINGQKMALKPTFNQQNNPDIMQFDSTNREHSPSITGPSECELRTIISPQSHSHTPHPRA